MTEPTLAPPAPLRVLVVDPDDRIRESLARLLPIGGRCLVVGSAGESDRALDLASTINPDVVMLDSRLPAEDPEGHLIDRLRSAYPAARIVVLNRADAGLPAGDVDGAHAYIKKTFRPHELIDAVVNAARLPLA
jgi:DNA-binding NarL/FixJ family response regulator